MFRSLLYIFVLSLLSIIVRADYTTKATNAIVINLSNSQVLFAKDPHIRVYPASITKLVSIYIIFDYLKNSKLSLSDTVIISKNAFRQGNVSTGGSTMFLNIGDQISVEDLIKGAIVVSGNDATVALAEKLAGNEANFVRLMNEYVRKLNLKETHFSNVHGIYSPTHYSTAYDLSILVKRLIKDFPEYYHYFAIKELEYNNIKQDNRNALLRVPFANGIMVDGLKTGHINISKYSLAFSATQDSKYRIIGILMTLNTDKERRNEGRKLINWIYSNYNTYTIYHKGDIIDTVPIYNSDVSELEIIVNNDIEIFLPRGMKTKDVHVKLVSKNYYMAPMRRGTVIARLDVTTPDPQYNTFYYLTLQKDVEESFFKFIALPYESLRKVLN